MKNNSYITLKTVETNGESQEEREEEEDKIYQANELLFAIYNKDDDPRMVALVPINFWNAEHHMADFIGGHNVDNTALLNGGMCNQELSEGFFGFWGKKTGNNILNRALGQYMIEMVAGAGFVYSQELTDFLEDERK